MSTQQAPNDSINQLVNGIERYFRQYPTYNFRPFQIDGINMYIVLYDKYKILNVESIRVECNVEIDGRTIQQKYSLYHHTYTSIRHALELVKKIKTEYRIYDGELCSTLTYKMLKLEESVLPYSDDEQCSICYVNTSNTTPCKHPICLRCRQECIMQCKLDCPVCREKKAVLYYTNRTNVVNNIVYIPLQNAIESEKNMPDDSHMVNRGRDDDITQSLTLQNEEEHMNEITEQGPMHIDEITEQEYED